MRSPRCNRTVSLSTTTDKVSAAFSDPSADITLRSSDGVLFKIQSYYLKAASPVMREILSLPASNKSCEEPIQMEEDGAALGLWLAFIVPDASRPTLGLKEVDMLMTVANKRVAHDSLGQTTEWLTVGRRQI